MIGRLLIATLRGRWLLRYLEYKLGRDRGWAEAHEDELRTHGVDLQAHFQRREYDIERLRRLTFR